MLFLVQMMVRPPIDETHHQAFETRKVAERERAIQLQQTGAWLHLWRVVGRYENYSVFNVDSHDELHTILSELPLFPYMEVNVIPLATHPSALEALDPK